MIVGLTGGIGSGKSTAVKIFKELGIDSIDADDVAKNIIDSNKNARKLFIEEFGDKYILKNHKINRDLLREDIFNDKSKIKKLESIIHPIVREEIFEFIQKSESIYTIIDVPLIFETKSEDFYNKIVVVDCDTNTQILRASQRDNKTEESILKIIGNQATREERFSIADYVINNDSSYGNLKKEVIKTHQLLLGLKVNE
jgi:dephospho-CoA kinase|tara:strand:- start:1047 stop:1643 length:597 start_codon:yes stop_codon:yes gene_type:complete